jgi:CHAD domain-containing protein
VLLERRAGALFDHLPGAAEGDERSLHQARVATRRLREGLPVVAAGVKKGRAKKPRRKLKRLTRALGGVRELDVTLRILDELATRADVSRPAIEEIRRLAGLERMSRRELMLERLSKVDAEKLKARLTRLAGKIDEDATGRWRAALGARVLKRAKALESAIKTAGHIYAPERLHGVRIAVKKLRYALELAADARVPHARPAVRTLKRVQEALGRLHDLQVVQRHVAEGQAQISPADGTSKAFEGVIRALEEECRHRHADYLASLPALERVIEIARSKVGPHFGDTETPLRRRMVKMALQRDRGAATGARHV